MRAPYTCLLAVISVVALGASSPDLRVVIAAKTATVDAVRTLVRQHADVNAAEADGMTALHWAVRADDAGMAQVLIEGGANVKASNRYGVTPLSLAVTNGDAKLTEILLKAGADVSAVMGDGETILMTAARTGSPDVIRTLVARGASVDAKEEWQGQTALMWAASQNNAAAVRVLAELGADLNINSRDLKFPEFKFVPAGMVTTLLPRGGWTALMYAARDGAVDAIRALAAAKADLNLQDPDGTTALILAIINAHYDAAAALVEEGANPNAADNTGMAALYAAVDMSRLPPMISRPAPKLIDQHSVSELIKLLLAHGANPNAQLKSRIIGRHHEPQGDALFGAGATPLMRAAKSGDFEVMRILLEGGADPNLTMKDRTTVMMFAARGAGGAGSLGGIATAKEADSLEAVKLCVEHGADLDAFNSNDGDTALHYAAMRGAGSIVKYLGQMGASIDLRDKQKHTPLEAALTSHLRPTYSENGDDLGGAAMQNAAVAVLRELKAQRELTAQKGKDQ